MAFFNDNISLRQEFYYRDGHDRSQFCYNVIYNSLHQISKASVCKNHQFQLWTLIKLLNKSNYFQKQRELAVEKITLHNIVENQHGSFFRINAALTEHSSIWLSRGYWRFLDWFPKFWRGKNITSVVVDILKVIFFALFTVQPASLLQLGCLATKVTPPYGVFMTISR